MAEWISVKDRLPEDEKSVLVITKNGKPWVAHYDLKWRGWRTSGSTTITHWMPLPEPPKED